jgi:hypothetical protein
MIIQSIWFCKMLGVKGIVLWPFIIINNKKNKVLIHHERIHMAQARELWVLGFYWLYLKWYFHNRKIFKGHKAIKHYWAYHHIPFELEAFAKQGELHYLADRKHNAWKDYL